MARPVASAQIVLFTIAVTFALLKPTEAWSGNVCSKLKSRARSTEICTRTYVGLWHSFPYCRTIYETTYYTEYQCCDGWTETVKGNQACTKRVPYRHNSVTSYQEVPSLPWRSLSSDEEVIDDTALSTGIYTTGEFFDIVTTEVDATSISCGAKRKIWMNDTLPEADGTFHKKTMCITDAETDNPCKDTFTIEVHNGGNFRVYALEAFNSSKYGLDNDTVSYCFDLSILMDPCSGTTPTSLPEIEFRRPANTDVIKSDNHLTAGWYSVEPYQIVTKSPDMDSPIRCGAKYQIWMNDTFPEMDGKHHIRKLCIMDPTTLDTCINNTHYTFIKNCGGIFRYFLSSTPKPDSAYCFDIPSDSDDPAPDFTPSNVKIDVSLTWIPEGFTSLRDTPILQFQCSFDKNDTQDFFYIVYFYVDGTYINTGSDIIVQDPNEAYVTEKTLFEHGGFTAGITISCSVGARSSRNGRTGVTGQSSGFYAGIKIIDDTIDVYGGERRVVRFFPTVPIGCTYNQATPSTTCDLTVVISDNNTYNLCERYTIQHQCTLELKGLTKGNYDAGIPWALNSSFEVVAVENKLVAKNLANENKKFILRLLTSSNHHAFWRNYESDTVTVNIKDTQYKTCEVHCDPHDLTFDGMRYELQYGGKFLLYKSTDPPIQVQVQIQSCYSNSAPYCACGLVAVVGRDVFQIYTCFGKNRITYEACSDQVLKVARIHSKLYKIHLPTGATIKVTLRGGLYANMMDIDFDIPSHLENRAEIIGLCGNFDGDSCNDCVNRGDQFPCKTPWRHGCQGSYCYFPNDFTSSYRLSEEESLLDVTPNITLLDPYPTSNQVCVCRPDSTNPFETEPSAQCDFTYNAGCEDADPEIKCGRLVSPKRRKRSVPQNIDKLEHERKRRSVVMTESEATNSCTLGFMNSPTYTLCANLDIPSSEIQTCTADLMATGDEIWIGFALDRYQASCVEYIENNATLQEQFPDEVNSIRNNTCPNSCSNKGSCINGVCDCDEGFASDDCSFNLSMPLIISGLENDDLCDLQYGCDVILVNGPEFPFGRNYTCQFTGQMTFINSSIHQLDVRNVSAEYQSLFGLLCGLPEVGTVPEQLGIEYSISVAMDPYEFSTAFSFVVINTLCQTFTNESGTISFDIKDGYCFINGACIPTGTDNSEDLCLECESQESVYTWSQSKDCSVGDLNSEAEVSSHMTAVLAVTCSVAMVFILVGLGVYYWKLHTKERSSKRGVGATAVFTVKEDPVRNIHFKHHDYLNKPSHELPGTDRAGRLFRKENKTLPFPLKNV